MKRLMVLGSRGFVGAHVARASAGDFDLISDAGIDITNASGLAAAFEDRRPEIVVLTAAMSDIDRCEREPKLARQVNVLGAMNVAEACRRIGARLLFTSSGAVFDGNAERYTEHDPPAPLSVYGRTKAESEAAVALTLPSAVILRLSLVLGLGLRSPTNSLIDKLAVSFIAGSRVIMPMDEYRNPIDVDSLSWFILSMAKRPEASGLFHIGCRDVISRYDLVCEIATRMGYSRELVELQSKPVPGRAPRGRNHLLVSDKIAAFCGSALPTLEQTLERCLHVTAQSHP